MKSRIQLAMRSISRWPLGENVCYHHHHYHRLHQRLHLRLRLSSLAGLETTASFVAFFRGSSSGHRRALLLVGRVTNRARPTYKEYHERRETKYVLVKLTLVKFRWEVYWPTSPPAVERGCLKRSAAPIRSRSIVDCGLQGIVAERGQSMKSLKKLE